MYEFCLEYGTFPISLITDDFTPSQAIPDFLQEDPDFLQELMELNSQFHSLFIEIEGNIDFIGRDEPEKIADLKQEYFRIAEQIRAKYPDIQIESFYLG